MAAKDQMKQNRIEESPEKKIQSKMDNKLQKKQKQGRGVTRKEEARQLG